MKRLALLLCTLFNLQAIASNEEIASAREGAPKRLSENASVLIWKNGSYVLAAKGSNEFTCIIWADPQGTWEPSCLNPAAVKAVLPVYEYQRSQLEAGVAISIIHKEIDKKAKSGEFPAPEPGAVVYMMSKGNKYYAHDEKKVYDVEPHIMLFYPKLQWKQMGFDGESGLPGFYDEWNHMSVVHIDTSPNSQKHAH